MEIIAKKKFGQNFISDPILVQKIVDLLGNDPQALVIEIGPGTGVLTKKLVQKFAKVIAIELDNDLCFYLQTHFLNANFKLINEDVLKVDLQKIILQETKPNQNIYLVSNLPYYITSPILFKTFAVSQELTKAVFMMQKEVAQRICASKNENNYNNLSVVSEFYATKKYEFTVPKGKFFPIPKVDSAVVSFVFRKTNLEKIADYQQFLDFVRLLFNNRRKTILNNLTNLTNNKVEALNLLNQVRINPKLRPQNIGLQEFMELFNIYFKKSKIIKRGFKCA